MLSLETQEYLTTIWNQFLQYLRRIFETCLAFFTHTTRTSHDLNAEIETTRAPTPINLEPADDVAAEGENHVQEQQSAQDMHTDAEAMVLESAVIEPNQTVLHNVMDKLPKWDPKFSVIALGFIVCSLFKYLLQQQDEELSRTSYPGFH
jgi:hypothetical protein